MLTEIYHKYIYFRYSQDSHIELINQTCLFEMANNYVICIVMRI